MNRRTVIALVDVLPFAACGRDPAVEAAATTIAAIGRAATLVSEAADYWGFANGAGLLVQAASPSLAPVLGTASAVGHAMIVAAQKVLGSA